MSCKACGKQLQGAQFDLGLCGTCLSVSNYYLEIAKGSEDEPVRSKYTKPSRQRFDKFVGEGNFLAIWAEGLGLRWTPEERSAHMYAKAWDEYSELISQGIGHYRALRRACRCSLRGNQRFAMAGSQQTGGTDGGTLTSVVNEDMMGHDAVSMDGLWDDI